MKYFIHYKHLLLWLILTLPAALFSQIIGTSGYIIGDNLEIGINDGGHEGAPRLVASNNRSNQGLGSPVYFGFVANPQLDGWGNYDGDFFTPGTPENGFGIQVNGINYANNASGPIEQIPGSITSYNTVGDCIFIEWDGAIANVDVHVVYRLIKTELYYTTEVTLTNTGGVDLVDVYYYRNLDPDNNVTIGGGYGTQNTIVAQPTPACEKALVTATQTGPWASYMGLGAIGENFRVSYGGFANRNAANIWNGAGGLTGLTGATAFADQAISIAYKVDLLEVGVPEKFLFTVVLDATQIDAAIASLYYFDYVGGGGVIDECAPIVDTAKTCAGLPVEISVDGPSSEDYVWTWAPPIGLSTTDGPTTEAAPLVTTEYTVTGTPAPLCLSATIEKTIVVEVTPSPIIEIVDPGPQCGDFDLTTLVVNNLEGSPGMELKFYSVIPDSVDQVAGIWPSDFMADGDVVYVMMYNPVTGCYDVEEIILDFSGGADAGLDNATVLCNDSGSSIDLNTLLIGAEPDGAWAETSVVLSGGLDPASGILNADGVDAGVYIFRYIAFGLPPCEDDTAFMTVEINQEALAGLDATAELCNTFGTTIDLDDLLDGNNAIGTWLETTASGQFDPVTGVFDASDLPAGDYTFTYTVSAIAPCLADVANFSVTILPNPAIIAGEDLSVCAGDEVVLSGAGAGVGGSYSWDGGVVNDVAFVPASTLIYTVTGTDANGCINTDDVLVTVNALPIVDAGADFDICFGDDATIVGAGAGAGGTYVWDAGVIDGVPFTPAATNIYTVIGTDINGCIGSDEIEVTVNALPLIFAGADFDVCEEDMATLTGSGAGIGGTYSWDSGVIDGIGFYPEATAIYVLTGTDANGCVNTDEIEVVVNELPTIEAGEPVVICYGDPVILAGSGAGYGGVYAWDGGVTNGLSFTPAVTATYTLTGTDANGCVNTDNVLVTVNALPAINAGPDYSICIGDDAVLSGSGAGVDGTYSWDGGVFNEVVFNPVITNSYTVTGTDINGCENTDMVIVTVIPLPIISAGPDFAICQGDPTSISASGAGPGGVYTWSGGIFDGLGFSPVSTSTYIVTGTTMDGCTNADTIEVVVNPLPDIAFYGDTLMGCAPLKVNFMSLNPGAVFDWNFGDGSYGTGSTTTHVFNSSGTYNVSLTATSVHGCVASDLIESYVDIARTPVAEFSYNPDEIDISDTRVQFDNSSVDADYYIWNFGDGSSEVTSTNAMHEYEPIGNTNYTVKLIAGSDHGCMDQTEQLIKIKDVLIFHVPNAFTPDGDTFNEEFKPIFVSGYDIFDYHLTIYNQWGERVFESYDANFGWNGTYGGGELVNDGVYVWQIEFGESMSDKRHYEGGHITVLK